MDSLITNHINQGKIEKAKRAELDKLLKECIFQPKVNSNLPEYLREESHGNISDLGVSNATGKNRILSLPFLDR